MSNADWYDFVHNCEDIHGVLSWWEEYDFFLLDHNGALWEGSSCLKMQRHICKVKAEIGYMGFSLTSFFSDEFNSQCCIRKVKVCHLAHRAKTMMTPIQHIDKELQAAGSKTGSPWHGHRIWYPFFKQ